MGYYAVWPYFAGMALICCLVAAAPFGALDAPPHESGARVTALDGLRGFLALSVVFHHIEVFHVLLVTGRWQLPPSPFYIMVGELSVVLFFMVTGYLFWGRLVRACGRLDWRSFYIGRVFRIGPVYLAAVLIMLVALFALTGPVLRVPLPTLLGQIALWLPLGLTKSRRINGTTISTQLLAGVTWTLGYEWVFYLALPLLGRLVRRPGRHLPCACLATGVVLAAALLVPAAPLMLALVFCLGALCASLEAVRPGPAGRDWLCSCLVLALLAIVATSFDTAYRVVPILLLGVAFRCVSAGCPVFGLLTFRGARRLGNISYDLYLFQGLLLNAFYLPLAGPALASPAAHWAIGTGAMAALVACAGLVHFVIERPGIAWGRALARRGPGSRRA